MPEHQQQTTTTSEQADGRDAAPATVGVRRLRRGEMETLSRGRSVSGYAVKTMAGARVLVGASFTLGPVYLGPDAAPSERPIRVPTASMSAAEVARSQRENPGTHQWAALKVTLDDATSYTSPPVHLLDTDVPELRNLPAMPDEVVPAGDGHGAEEHLAPAPAWGSQVTVTLLARGSGPREAVERVTSALEGAGFSTATALHGQSPTGERGYLLRVRSRPVLDERVDVHASSPEGASRLLGVHLLAAEATYLSALLRTGERLSTTPSDGLPVVGR